MAYNVFLDLYFKYWKIPRMHREYSRLSLADTFTRIYQTKQWATEPGPGEEFNSGFGSLGPAGERLCQRVADFIKTHSLETVADLGCGDFRAGQRITSLSNAKYVGVDIVPGLVARNTTAFGTERISFECRNLASDSLPAADLCLVRQVLQHLSNAEIEVVLRNISRYKFALISEHVPKRPRSFNRDKPHGPDVRGSFGSGVYLEKPPFSRKASVLWEDELNPSSLLRTMLIKH